MSLFCTDPGYRMSIEPSANSAIIEELTSLHNRGLYLQAFDLTHKVGPLKEWRDPSMQVIGGRLAHNLGSSRLGRIMHWAAYQQNPDDPEIAYFYVLSMSDRWGPLKTLDRMSEITHVAESSEVLCAHWAAHKAIVLTTLRDFERAETMFDEAIALQPNDSWLYVCKTGLLSHQDRPELALEVARKAFEVQPWYRPAVQNLFHRLIQMNQDEEAQTLMTEAVQRLESGDLRCQLAAFYLESQQYQLAREIYEDVERFLPLQHLERKGPQWLSARLADGAYYCGDHTSAITHAKAADSPFYKTLAENLETSDFDGNRVLLPVKFVRQNHMTCAPATLAALSSFWNMPAEHLDLAEEICFDGTPAHRERSWAESQGYVAREFRVTIESAQQLIDRGVPFTLTTVNPGNAHLQAVVGYDTYRDSLLIRDPGERHFNEFPMKEMLELYAANGPRGMAMVPVDRADLLDEIEFPDAEFYDLQHRVDVAIEKHLRDEAEQVVAQMISLDETHRLTLRARGSLAFYDANTPELLSVADAMLEKYPDDVNTLMYKLSCLQELGRRADRLQLLEDQIAKTDCDPMFWSRYASELIDDVREYEQATYYLEKTVRRRPFDVPAYDMLASIAMGRQQQDRAIMLYRFAACLGDMNEGQARSYFSAARLKNQTSDALKFLKDRFIRFGQKSSQPTKTLAGALDLLDRTSDAFKVLEKGAKLRPDDADFTLYLAAFYGRYGNFDQAGELLQQAKSCCHKTAWLRTDALLNSYQGEHAAALANWQEVVESEPLDIAAHHNVTELLVDTQGVPAAIDHLKAYVERFPYSYGLRTLLIERLREQDSPEVESQLQEFMTLYPSDAWAIRELAFHCLKHRKFDRAKTLMDEAEQIEPTNPAIGFVRGRVSVAEKDVEGAREHFRHSLRQNIDYEFSILGLVDCCASKSEREEALEFVYSELEKQVTFGGGLLSYRDQAAYTLESKDLLSRLQEALKQRPDMWQAWSAVMLQLSDMQRHQEAVEFAKKATDRFPLLPRMWIDYAVACAACGDIEGEIQCLCKARDINPTWSEARRNLADAYQKKGDVAAARAEIERAIANEPRDVPNLGALAGLMWDEGQKKEAVHTLVTAVQLRPDYAYGWSLLRAWAAELKKNDLVIDVAREMTKKRPGDYQSWLVFAQSLGERDQIELAVNALNKAIKLNPANYDAHNQKAVHLTRAGRFDEAIKAAKPKVFRDRLPIELEARIAWIEGERGNVTRAVTLMEKVVNRDQDYYWAWHRLAEWYDFLNNDASYLEAAQQMSRIAPQDPVPWGYLGDAEFRRGKKKEAKRNFLQAVKLSPSYSFGSSRLIDMQLEDKEFDDALATIELISPHIPGAWTLSEKLRVESLRENQKTAFGLLEQLAITEAEDSSAIDAAVESLFNAGWGEKVLPRINKLLDQPDAQPGVAYVYVHLSATLEEWQQCEARLKSLEARPGMWKEGARKFVEELANGNQLPRFHKFVKKHRRKLTDDADLWDAVGDAYCSATLFQDSLKWMKGWQDRPGVTPNNVLVVSNAYWRLKKPHQAVKTSRFAMQNLDPDNTTPVHLTLMSFYELIYGSPEACVDALSMVDTDSIGGIYRFIYQYIVTIVENLSVGASYGELSARLKAQWDPLSPEAKQIPYLAWVNKLANWRAATLHGKNFRAFWQQLWL